MQGNWPEPCHGSTDGHEGLAGALPFARKLKGGPAPLGGLTALLRRIDSNLSLARSRVPLVAPEIHHRKRSISMQLDDVLGRLEDPALE